MQHFGIIGFPLVQSFSAKHFTEKFEREQIDADYQLFPLEDIKQFPQLISQHKFRGLNVTLPHKQSIIPFLDELDDTAHGVGAVNVIKFTDEGKLIGYNSDTGGFFRDIKPLLQVSPVKCDKALVLGTGGAAKAVAYALRRLGIEVSFVSRSDKYDYTYSDLTRQVVEQHLLIVNCTPLGMYPDTDACPQIPYEYLTDKHLLYDVIYNPARTLFLQKGEQQGATVSNGLGMLYGQAQEAWEIWSK